MRQQDHLGRQHNDLDDTRPPRDAGNRVRLPGRPDFSDAAESNRSDFDPDDHLGRLEQLALFDDDDDDELWRGERYKKFSQGFSQRRGKRAASQSEGGFERRRGKQR